MQFMTTLELTKVPQLYSQNVKEKNENTKMIKGLNNRMAFFELKTFHLMSHKIGRTYTQYTD